MSNRPLSPLHRLFVDEFMKDRDADEAHRRIGVDPSQHLDELPGVAAEIIRRTMEAQLDEGDVSLEAIVAQLMKNAAAAARARNFGASNQALKFVADLKGYTGKKKAEPAEPDPLSQMGFGNPG